MNGGAGCMGRRWWEIFPTLTERKKQKGLLTRIICFICRLDRTCTNTNSSSLTLFLFLVTQGHPKQQHKQPHSRREEERMWLHQIQPAIPEAWARQPRDFLLPLLLVRLRSGSEAGGRDTFFGWREASVSFRASVSGLLPSPHAILEHPLPPLRPAPEEFSRLYVRDRQMGCHSRIGI